MRIVIVTLLFLLPILGFAQKTPLFTNALSLEYNDVSIGRNFNLTYHHTLSKTWSLYGGVKYHVNRTGTPDDQHNVFTKRFYAEKPIQHFGLKLGLEKTVYRSATGELFGFYDFQFTRALIHDAEYSSVGADSTGNTRYTYGTFLFGPINSYENTFGFGTRFKLSNRIYIKGFIGGGAMILSYKIEDPVHKTVLVGSGTDLEFIRMFGAGIDFKLK